MKRQVLVALVALLLSGLGWWGGKSASREADRLMRIAAIIPPPAAVFPEPSRGNDPVIEDLPENPLMYSREEERLVPTTEPRRQAERDAMTFYALSEWAYRAVWLAPLAGLFLIMWMRIKQLEAERAEHAVVQTSPAFGDGHRPAVVGSGPDAALGAGIEGGGRTASGGAWTGNDEAPHAGAGAVADTREPGTPGEIGSYLGDGSLDDHRRGGSRAERVASDPLLGAGRGVAGTSREETP